MWRGWSEECDRETRDKLDKANGQLEDDSRFGNAGRSELIIDQLLFLFGFTTDEA